jgi:hypothetical protein
LKITPLETARDVQQNAWQISAANLLIRYVQRWSGQDSLCR